MRLLKFDGLVLEAIRMHPVGEVANISSVIDRMPVLLSTYCNPDVIRVQGALDRLEDHGQIRSIDGGELYTAELHIWEGADPLKCAMCRVPFTDAVRFSPCDPEQWVERVWNE